MPKFVIEREIPGAGSLSPEQLQAISQKSCGVLRNLGPADSVAAQLRHRRQDLLRLHRAQRRDGARTRQPGRLSGQQRRAKSKPSSIPTTAEALSSDFGPAHCCRVTIAQAADRQPHYHGVSARSRWPPPKPQPAPCPPSTSSSRPAAFWRARRCPTSTAPASSKWPRPSSAPSPSAAT